MVRARTQLEHLQTEIASVARKTGISSATKLALIAPSVDQAEDVPEVEWWDAAILPGKRYVLYGTTWQRLSGVGEGALVQVCV